MIAAPRRSFSVSIPGRAPLVLGPRTLVMGVINVTPDSFSDGGKALDPAHALDIALAMEAAGADIIDLGAESTRPGAKPVAAARGARARAAGAAGAGAAHQGADLNRHLQGGGRLPRRSTRARRSSTTSAASTTTPAWARSWPARGVPAVLMHTRGRPDDMYAHADYADVVGEVVGRPSAVRRPRPGLRRRAATS